MNASFKQSPLVLAVAAALTATALAHADNDRGRERDRNRGTYLAGDFHNHSTCSDGSISMQKLVKKATDKVDTPWGLDWFVQAGHGGNGNRNCTLVEDATLSTPAYPFVTGKGPTTTWADSIGAANVKGNTPSATATSTTPNSTQANPILWRWQSIQEFQYPVVEYLSALKGLPLFLGIESVVAGHEHSSMSVITGQIPSATFQQRLPSTPGYTALGNATALAQWTYCFDRADTDNSRGGGQNWDCSVSGSPNNTDPSWNPTARKLVPQAPDIGVKGHLKTIEAVKWMNERHPRGSYYIPAHLERAGPFNPGGNNGYNIEHLRNFNNAAPTVAFGMETQPGHGASDARGEYTIRRNTIGTQRIDSVGGTTYGGTGVYGALVGGVWDALLGEGRNWWFFASSDWHNRGTFGPDDRRSTQDFFPGEYQRNYTLVRQRENRFVKTSPQAIVNGLRTGNNWAASGQLIDRLAFVACSGKRSIQAVESAALNAAREGTDVELEGCAGMGEKLVVPPGADVIVSIVVRDPAGTNYSPYTFDNPSLAQVGIRQPLNAPVLDHIDVIRGLVTGYKTPGTPEYSGQWPSDWIDNPNLANVPAGAKNLSATVIKTFGEGTWTSVRRDPEFKVMTFRIPSVAQSQYVRLRGTNLPPSVPFETDANGNPLPDLWTNATAVAFRDAAVAGNEFPEGNFLRIPCRVTGTSVPANNVVYTGAAINGCPNHLPVKDGVKYTAYDVAAWADLWFYSNPIFIEVRGSTVVAGVR